VTRPGLGRVCAGPVAGAAELAAAYAVRREVFGIEQGVPPEIERDPLDAVADHVVARRDGEVVGTGRLVARPDGFGVVGRMAVCPAVRGAGVGRAVLTALEGAARARGLRGVELHAQSHARGFYDRAGYAAYGAEFVEAGIRHVAMRKALPLVRVATDADSAALIALIEGCWSEYPGCVMDVDGEEPWLRAPASAYAEKGGTLEVVELDGEVVACVGVTPEGAGTVSLRSLYVAAAARRQGLGGELVARVESEARSRGAGRVHLWSDTRFTDAHRLYERSGYARLPGSRELHDRSNTVEFPFAKDLALP
jgi:predicted GNAT family N-acyltransferase